MSVPATGFVVLTALHIAHSFTTENTDYYVIDNIVQSSLMACIAELCGLVGLGFISWTIAIPVIIGILFRSYLLFTNYLL